MSKKILIAEDSPTILLMMKTAICNEGYEVLSSTDGMEALEKARTQNPDLIVLDCILPKLDGYHICQTLKKDENLKKIPVFLHSARAGVNGQLIEQKTGADEYIPKSTSTEDFGVLIEKINQYLK